MVYFLKEDWVLGCSEHFFRKLVFDNIEKSCFGTAIFAKILLKIALSGLYFFWRARCFFF